jgi:hypothetical protein
MIARRLAIEISAAQVPQPPLWRTKRRSCLFVGAFPDVAVTIGSTAVTIQNRIQRELDRTLFCKYVAPANVPPSLIEDSKRSIFPKWTRIFHNHDTRQLIVKLVARPHEIA